MPIVEITVAQGRSRTDLGAMMHSVHDAVEASLGAPAESIRVMVREVPEELWLTGGITLREKRSAASGPTSGTYPK